MPMILEMQENLQIKYLILGTSYSARGYWFTMLKYGCKSVIVTQTAPMGFDWPENWKEVPAYW